MIDLEKEEFLQRLDIRIAIISEMLAYHEKHLLADLPQKAFRKAELNIDKMCLDFNNFIQKTDERIKNMFEEARSGIQKKREANK